MKPETGPDHRRNLSKIGVSGRQIYKDINYEGLDCGEHHADEAMMRNIKPGDWIWYNNYHLTETPPERAPRRPRLELRSRNRRGRDGEWIRRQRNKGSQKISKKIQSPEL